MKTNVVTMLSYAKLRNSSLHKQEDQDSRQRSARFYRTFRRILRKSPNATNENVSQGMRNAFLFVCLHSAKISHMLTKNKFYPGDWIV